MTASSAITGRERAHTGASTMAWIAAFAFAIRLAWGLAADVTPGSAGIDDSVWYRQSAILIMNGYGYANAFTGLPSAQWPPGYPALLSVVYRIFGASTPTTVVVNALASTLTCVVVWRLGRPLVGPRAALIAAALLACFPSQIFFVALTLSESVFTCVAMALILAGVRLLAADGGSLRWMAWGIGLGIVTLVRSEVIAWFLAPAVVVFWWHGIGRAIRVLTATVLGLALALAPWTVRNAHVFGTFVPTNVGLGRTLWAGHNDAATGEMTEEIQRGIQASMTRAGLSLAGPAGELAVNQLLVAESVAFAKAHPGRELALIPARFFHLFRGDHVWTVWYGPNAPRFMPSEQSRQRLSRIGDVYYLAILLLAPVGLIIRGRSPTAAWGLLDVLVLLCVTTFSLTLGDPRYHHMLMPPACLLAALALARLVPERDGPARDAAHAA